MPIQKLYSPCGAVSLRTLALLCLVVSALAVLALSTPDVVRVLTGYEHVSDLLDARNRELAVGRFSKTDGSVDVGILEPSELDFTSKSEIFLRRRELVNQVQILAPLRYSPDSGVFGQIVDGLPWWGLEGIYFFGPGSRSIEGRSEESRFINNPYLLVGVLEDRAWVTKARPDEIGKAFPRPTELTYFPKEQRAEVSYDLKRYIAHLNAYTHFSYKEGALPVALSAYNARDFGYRFCALQSVNTEAVTLAPEASVPFPILHFIHQGGSCRYEEGCNNMSPHQPEFDLKIKQLPGTLNVFLWRLKPRSADELPDFTFAIKLR